MEPAPTSAPALVLAALAARGKSTPAEMWDWYRETYKGVPDPIKDVAVRQAAVRMAEDGRIVSISNEMHGGYRLPHPWERRLKRPSRKVSPTVTPPDGATDPLRPGYRTEDDYERTQGNGTTSPEPLAPPGRVLVLVFNGPDGRPIYGFDHTGDAVQLGPAIRATANLSTAAVSATG
ncbi:MAG TPA: hypothetical protein VF576_08890 [Rubricoccaceae bacterium]